MLTFKQTKLVVKRMNRWLKNSLNAMTNRIQPLTCSYLVPRLTIIFCCHKAEPFSYCLFGTIIVKTHLQYFDQLQKVSYLVAGKSPYIWMRILKLVEIHNVCATESWSKYTTLQHNKWKPTI